MWWKILLVLAILCCNVFAFESKDSFEEEVVCAVCYTLVNEIEGLPAENWTRHDIQDYLTTKWCGQLSGTAKVGCDLLVSMLPAVLQYLDGEFPPGQVCHDLTLCRKAPHSLPDPAPMPRFVVDLDLPAAYRWAPVWTGFKGTVDHFVALMQAVLPTDVYSGMLDAGQVILDNVEKSYRDEMLGGAKALGVDAPIVGLLNAAYELTDVCTSIVAQDPAGNVFHARNLDFAFSMYGTELLRNLSVELDFQQGNRTVFRATSYAGYVGILTGMRPDGFSISIDTRFAPGGFFQAILDLAESLARGTATMNSHLVRDTLNNVDNYPQAAAALRNVEVISDIYFIIAGVKQNEGEVIARSFDNPDYVNPLGAKPYFFFTLVTNYGFCADDDADCKNQTSPVPWWDNRQVAAIDSMLALGQNRVNLNGLYDVLDVKPVLNRLTTLTVLMQPASSSYTSYRRSCGDPCPF